MTGLFGGAFDPPHLGHVGLVSAAKQHFELPQLTILVVAWVAVPSVARFVNAWAGYAPLHYEPKDFERQTWLERHAPDTLLGRLEWNDLIGIGLFLLVAVVWLTLVPDRTPRRRP